MPKKPRKVAVIRTILNDRKSSKIWLHGTRKAWKVVDLKVLPYSTLNPTAITAHVSIQSGHSSGRYSPTSTIWWNLHYNANLIAALNYQENGMRPASVVINENQIIYDSNMWIYANDYTSNDPVTVMVVLEEVALNDIGQIESLARVATYMGERAPT
jgi:hypothetical protein